MQSMRPIDRLTLLVCVLTGLVVGMKFEPYLSEIPERYFWIRMLLQVMIITGSMIGVARWIFYSGSYFENDNPHIKITMKPMKPIEGYVIHKTADGIGITCMRCGMTSFNPNDIAMLWCGRCKQHHTAPPSMWKDN